MPFLPIHDHNDRQRISTPYVTWCAILLCVVVFLWQAGLPEREGFRRTLAFGYVPGLMFADLRLAPGLKEIPVVLTLVTTQFLHADFGHLIGNMIFLYIFGDNVEDATGHVRFVAFFLLCGILAALAHGISVPDSRTPLVGASGAISGILGAYLLLRPRSRILVLLSIVPMRLPAWLLVIGWFALQLLFGLAPTDGDRVAYWAHIGGFVAGIALLPFFKAREVRYFGD